MRLPAGTSQRLVSDSYHHFECTSCTMLPELVAVELLRQRQMQSALLPYRCSNCGAAVPYTLQQQQYMLATKASCKLQTPESLAKAIRSHVYMCELTSATPPCPLRALQMDCACARLVARPPPDALAVATACAAQMALSMLCCFNWRAAAQQRRARCEYRNTSKCDPAFSASQHVPACEAANKATNAMKVVYLPIVAGVKDSQAV